MVTWMLNLLVHIIILRGKMGEEELELMYQAINRLGALTEQYDMLEQTHAQVEMQMEILKRVPDSKQLPGSIKQTSDQLVSTEAYKDAVLRLIRDTSGKDIGELRQTLIELRIALTKYSELQTEYTKTKQAFDILRETDSFDPEEGTGGSRKEYVEELDHIKANKEFLASYLRRLVLNCLNKNPLVVPTDSVLGPLIRQSSKET